MKSKVAEAKDVQRVREGVAGIKFSRFWWTCMIHGGVSPYYYGKLGVIENDNDLFVFLKRTL